MYADVYHQYHDILLNTMSSHTFQQVYLDILQAKFGPTVGSYMYQTPVYDYPDYINSYITFLNNTYVLGTGEYYSFLSEKLVQMPKYHKKVFNFETIDEFLIPYFIKNRQISGYYPNIKKNKSTLNFLETLLYFPKNLTYKFLMDFYMKPRIDNLDFKQFSNFRLLLPEYWFHPLVPNYTFDEIIVKKTNLQLTVLNLKHKFNTYNNLDTLEEFSEGRGY